MAKLPAQSERAKIIVVIVLSILFIVVGYFRFFHGSMGLTKGPARDAASSPLMINIPVPDVKNVLTAAPPTGQVPESPRTRLRNLFAPPGGPVAANGSAPPAVLEPVKPLPSLKLTGTIVDGRRSIAIINGLFLKIGDRIEGFQITSITRSQVSLEDEGRMILLDVLENAKKGDKRGFKN